MIGNKSDFAALLKTKVPDIIVKHCFLHRHALAAKTLPPNLNDVLSICVQVVNFIHGSPLYQGCGSGYFSTASDSAFTPIASASTASANKKRENDR